MRKRREVETKYGTVYLLFTAATTQEVVLIPRHGKERNIPPQRMNYKPYPAAFTELGVENIIGGTSFGRFIRAIKPLTFNSSY